MQTAVLDAVKRRLVARGVTVGAVDDGLLLNGHPFSPLEIEAQLRQESGRRLLRQLARGRHAERPYLLVADLFTDEELRFAEELDLDAADAQGNAHLRLAGLVLEVRGRRPDRSALDRRVPTPHREPPAGVRGAAPRRPAVAVTFVLLTDPRLQTAPLRSLAAAAGVSLGTAQRIVAELRRTGMLTDRGLADPTPLAHRWLEDYARVPVPTRLFNAPPSWWQEVTPEQQEAAEIRWGGETAAQLIRGYLRSSRGVAYVPALPREILARFRMWAASARVHEAHARAEFRTTWWGADWAPPADRSDTVPALLVYADLRRSDDGRLHEAAEDLRENHDGLRRLLG